MNFLNSPLEQFKIIIIIPFSILGFDFSISNATVYLFLVAFFLYLLFVVSVREARIIADPYQRLAELMYILVNNLVKQQAGIKGLRYFPVLFTLFYLISADNFLKLPINFFKSIQYSIFLRKTLTNIIC